MHTTRIYFSLLALLFALQSHGQYNSDFPENAQDSINQRNALQLSIDNALAKGDKIAAASAKWALADWLERFGQAEGVKKLYTDAEQTFEQANMPDSLAAVCIRLELFGLNTGDFVGAMHYALKAMDNFKKVGNREGVARCNMEIADILNYQEKHTEGAEYAKKAIAEMKSLGMKQELIWSYQILASNLAYNDSLLPDALVAIEKAIVAAQDFEFEPKDITLAGLNNVKGGVLRSMGRYDEAIKSYQTDIDNVKSYNLPEYHLQVSLANIGETYFLQGNYKKAIAVKRSVIEKREALGDFQDMEENYLRVAEAYKALGNTDSALFFKDKYIAQTIKDYNKKIEFLESELQVKFESAEKEETIAAQSETINSQKKIQWLYLGIAALLGILTIGVVLGLRNNKKKNVLLEQKNQQNELLLREIHHRVKNNLEMVKSLISLQSAQLSDEASQEAMRASQNRVQSMGIIHQKLYQGENLGSLDMKDYFENLSEGILDAYDAEDRIAINCAMEQLELDVDSAVPIGLIVNELLTNAIKYAFPTGQNGEINISLNQKSPTVLELIVADNGVGKVSGAVAQGTGFGSQLVNLLTVQLDGKMKENSDNGTAISFEFNIPQAA